MPNAQQKKSTRPASSEKGFTLVEVVLVMVVTGIVFISIYGLFAHTVKQDLESRYEIMASSLVQEGIEIIRNIRDQNQMDGDSIDQGISNPCKPYITTGTYQPVCDNSRTDNIGYNLKFESCSGSCGATATPFNRTCSTSCDDTDPLSGDCVRMTVICIVSWNSFVNPALNRQVEARSVLTSWQVE